MKDIRLISRGGWNATSEGLSGCIKAGYYKTGVANLFAKDGHRATGVIDVYEKDDSGDEGEES